MIASIVIGSGNNRRVIDMVPDRQQRASVARAITGHLFQTSGAYHRAMRQGKRRAAAYKGGVQ